MNDSKKTAGPQLVGDILTSFDPLKDKYISREFQKYGYDLAVEAFKIALEGGVDQAVNRSLKMKRNLTKAYKDCKI